ncbi:MAG: transcriptional regulator [Muribaculaceae bacterium]|nr:transcriptional regulator [Muribaculaceae bacterium]
MSPAEKLALPQITSLTDLNRLPSADRISAARSKYAAAVELYASSSLTIREIAEETGLTPKALSKHLSTHCRHLLYKRYGMAVPPNDRPIRIKSPRGQSRATHLKYKEAIEACGDIAYVEFNVSQIARIFGLNPTGLSAQLKVHYPDIIPARETLRKRLGIADRLQRGAKASSRSAYAEAVTLYRDSDLTIREVADRFGISASGLGQHMRHYHHDTIAAKARSRRESKRDTYDRREGALSGNGQLYGPHPQTSRLYERAFELYNEGRKTISEVVRETGVPPAGFRHYLDQWCREARRNRKDGKYGEAIASLRANPRAVTEVAREFGLNADVFREYIKNHAPDLAEGQGMVRLDNGKLVKKTAWDKYRPAIEEYRKEGGSLRPIALRHGLTYNSLLSFLKRTFGDSKPTTENRGS